MTAVALKNPGKGAAVAFWQSAILDDLEARLEKMPIRTFEVAAMIAVRARTTLVCSLGKRSVSRHLRMAERTAMEILKALESEGWLVKVQEASALRQEAAEYRLAVPGRLSGDFRKWIDPPKPAKRKAELRPETPTPDVPDTIPEWVVEPYKNPHDPWADSTW